VLLCGDGMFVDLTTRSAARGNFLHCRQRLKIKVYVEKETI